MPNDTTFTLEIPAFLKRAGRDPFDYDNSPISTWPLIPTPHQRRFMDPQHAPSDQADALPPIATPPHVRRPLSGRARDHAAFAIIAAIGRGYNTFGKLRKHCAGWSPALRDAQIKSAIRRALYLHRIELTGRTYSKV